MAILIEDMLPGIKYNGLNTNKDVDFNGAVDLGGATTKLPMLYDANGNEVLQLNSNASAVNYVKISNSAANSGVRIEAAGDDTSIQLLLGGKGVYGVEFLSSGTATASVSSSTASTVTSNSQMSKITVDLSGGNATGAGASHVLTVTNNKIQTFSRLMCTIGNGTNTAGEPCLLTCTQGLGTATITIKNVHGANAFNGTLIANLLVL